MIELFSFPSALCDGGPPGKLRLYYDDSIPILSFGISADSVQVYPIQSFCYFRLDPDDDTKFSFTFADNPSPHHFTLKTADHLATLVQLLLSHRLMTCDPNQENTLIPAQASPHPHKSIPTDFATPEFSLAAHQNLLRRRAADGRATPLYRKLRAPVTVAQFRPFFDGPDRLDEYLNVRKQWEIRIPYQASCKSRHNSDVDSLSKDLLRTVGSDRTITLFYTVVHTMIQFAPDLGFAQGMLDVVKLVAEIELEGDLDRTDDAAQSALFWSWHALLFDFGLAAWYRATEAKAAQLVEFAVRMIAGVSPTVEAFVSHGDWEIFRHAIGVAVTLATRLFQPNLIVSVWNLIFEAGTVDLVDAAVLAVLFCREYHEIVMKNGKPDIQKVSKLMDERYEVADEEDFLGLLAAVSGRGPEKERPTPLPEFHCSLFTPIQF
jgi:hypothetical protein